MSSIPVYKDGGLTKENIQGIINKYSKGKSPLTAENYIKVSNETGVPIELLLVQGIQESNFGTAGRAVRTRNVGNVGNTDDGSARNMNSWEDGLRAQANLLRKEYGATSMSAVRNLISNGFVRPKDKARYASDPQYEKRLSGLLKTITGQDFSAYKGSSDYEPSQSPYSKYDFSNQKLDYSQMNAQMESNQAFQKAMVEAMQSEASSKIALNQAQTLAIEREQAEKLALQEEEKKKAEQEQIQSVLDEKNKQREILMEVGLQAIPEFIEKDTNVLNQIASSPMNFQFQGGFQQLVQGQDGGMFNKIYDNYKKTNITDLKSSLVYSYQVGGELSNVDNEEDELSDIELAEVVNLNIKTTPFNNIPIYKSIDDFRERNEDLTTSLPYFSDNKIQYVEKPMFKENIGDAMFNVADSEIRDNEGRVLKLPEQCTARACRVVDSMVGGNSYLDYSDEFKSKIGASVSTKNKPTEEEIIENPHYYEDENFGSLDAWDIAYMTNKNSPKNVIFDAMQGQRVLRQDEVQKNMISINDLKKKVNEIPIGSFIGLGMKNGKNTSEVLGGTHTVRVVGYDDKGEPLVADFDSVKELRKAMYIAGDTDVKSIMSIVSVPGKEKYNYSYFKNLKNKSKKESNERYIKDYTKMPVFNTDSGKIEYEKPSKEYKKYAKTLNKNKNYLTALADISDEDYDRYAKIALTLPSVETKYGKDFLYSLGIDGESTGLSQLVQSNVKEKYPKVLSKYPKKSAERDALSTILYLKELDNYRESWFDEAESETERPYFLQGRSNIKDGVRKIQGRDRTGFYKNLVSGYTYNVDGNSIDIDSIDSKETEEDYIKRINSQLKNPNLRFALESRGGKEKKPVIYKKTKGNTIERALENSIGYLWQSPNSVRYGDAQGDSGYYKKFKAVYENLFNKRMQDGGIFHKMYDNYKKVDINSFKNKFIK